MRDAGDAGAWPPNRSMPPAERLRIDTHRVQIGVERQRREDLSVRVAPSIAACHGWCAR